MSRHHKPNLVKKNSFTRDFWANRWTFTVLWVYLFIYLFIFWGTHREQIPWRKLTVKVTAPHLSVMRVIVLYSYIDFEVHRPSLSENMVDFRQGVKRPVDLDFWSYDL